MVTSTRVARLPNTTVAGDLLRLVRPGRLTGNALVVSVPLLDPQAWRLATLGRVAWAVLVFTLATALIYLLDDVVDRERDRRHPANRYRPIAADRLAMSTVALFAVALLLLLTSLLNRQPWAWAWPVGGYLVLGTAYSLGLKHVPLLDVFVVASAFLLRPMQGHQATGTDPSGWLMTCVFSLGLLLVIGSRRHELASTGGVHRPALRGYTLPLTEQFMAFSAVLAAGSYLLYLRTEAPFGQHGPTATMLIAPLALFGLSRYLQLALAGDERAGAPLRDPALVTSAVLGAGVSAGFLLAARGGAW